MTIFISVGGWAVHKVPALQTAIQPRHRVIDVALVCMHALWKMWVVQALARYVLVSGWVNLSLTNSIDVFSNSLRSVLIPLVSVIINVGHTEQKWCSTSLHQRRHAHTHTHTYILTGYIYNMLLLCATDCMAVGRQILVSQVLCMLL